MSTVSNNVNSVNSVNSYSAVLPPSPMVFFRPRSRALLTKTVPPLKNGNKEKNNLNYQIELFLPHSKNNLDTLLFQCQFA